MVLETKKKDKATKVKAAEPARWQAEDKDMRMERDSFKTTLLKTLIVYILILFSSAGSYSS